MDYSNPCLGHLHFWRRGVSRRQFLARTAGAVAGVATASMWAPAAVYADEDEVGAAPVPFRGE